MSLNRTSDKELLAMRLCDLPIDLDAAPLRSATRKLFRELRGKGISFRPHLWLSDGWFAPDDVGGIAVPFYLAHPRLRKLEQAQMLDVEGGTAEWCMRLLRHETGHAIDNAYQLHERREYRKLFGKYHKKYPETYRPRAGSKDFVVNLDLFYAQAHPAEDFAETFAVWLDPRSRWREIYRGDGAMEKLHAVELFMQDVAERKPMIRSRERYKPLRSLRVTLREHYEQKRQFYLRDHPRVQTGALRRIFSDAAKDARKRDAGDFVESVRQAIREIVSRKTGESALTIDATLVDIVVAAQKLRLHLGSSSRKAKDDLLALVARQTVKFQKHPRYRVVV